MDKAEKVELKNINWVLMPVIDCFDFTKQAVLDCLKQELPEGEEVRVLVIDNGSGRDARRGLEELAMEVPRHRVLPIFHNPPLGGPPVGTLNATWNYGLTLLFNTFGASNVLVVNNDIRLRPWTLTALQRFMATEQALFVSAVGVRDQQFEAYQAPTEPEYDNGQLRKGGPDFSCFLISRECHAKYQFDEAFTYYGDNDYHRRIVLGGDGERIFGVNIPYLHYASQTLKQMAPERRKLYEQASATHGERYLRKWGGRPGHERFMEPWDGEGAKVRQMFGGSTLGEPDAFTKRRLAEIDRLQNGRPPLNPEPGGGDAVQG